MLLRLRLEAHHENRLRVGSAYQSPSVAEQHADTVNVDDLVLCREIFRRLGDDGELCFVRAWDTQLWCGDKLRDVSKHLVNADSTIGNDFQQARSAVERVVETIVAFGKEHVSGHLASD